MPAKKKRRPSTNSASFSGQVRAIIAVRGLKASAVAKAAGVTPSVLTRFLNRERGLTTETFDLVAEALGLRLVETGRGLGRGGKANRPGVTLRSAPLFGAGEAEVAPAGELSFSEGDEAEV